MANLTWDPVNNVWTGTFTVGANGNSNETYTIPITNTSGNVTVSLDGVNTSLFPGATNSINVIDCSSWTLTSTPASGSSITEGSNIQVTLNTANVANGNYPFSITGLQSGDLLTGSDVSWDGLSKYVGSFNLNNNTATITLNVLSDNNSENPETLTLSLDNSEGNSITITINDPAPPVACGAGISNSILTTGSLIGGLSGIGLNGFENGGTFYYPDFGGASVMPYSIVFKVGSTGVLGLMSVYNNLSNPSIQTVSYQSVGGLCYQADLSDPVDSQGAIVLNEV